MPNKQALQNPFPGLRPFQSDEEHLFFGRENQTLELLQILRDNRFVGVIGTSGSGKASTGVPFISSSNRDNNHVVYSQTQYNIMGV